MEDSATSTRDGIRGEVAAIRELGNGIRADKGALFRAEEAEWLRQVLAQG